MRRIWKLDQNREASGQGSGHVPLTSLQESQAAQGIIDLVGEVDGDMAMYVRHVLAIAQATGIPEITVLISSPGGDDHHELMIYDMISRFRGASTGIVVGEAFSAACTILQACTVRAAYPHALFLIHDPSAVSVSVDELVDRKKFTELKKGLLKSQWYSDEILRERTGRTLGQIRKQCLKEKVMDAEEALAFRLIDKII